MSRRKWIARLAPLLAAALALTACGSDTSGGLKGVDEQETGKNSINPVPREALRQGGTFTVATDDLPNNWNYHQVDGRHLPGKEMLGAIMPRIFLAQPDNTYRPNPDYVESAKLTSEDPQVVTYQINPDARWSNGRPITYRDFQAQAGALDGANKQYQASTNTGYQDIERVRRGADDREVKVTFDKRFGDWKSLFNPLYPKELMSDPGTFNAGWVNRPGITAGPFEIGRIDRTAKVVTMVPDPDWWGERPKLDQLIFKVVDRSALADAMANKSIDYYEIGSSVDLFARARSTEGVDIRQAPVPQYNMIAFNNGGVLASRELRIALMKALDPASMARAMLGQMVRDPEPLGNHIYVDGTRQYQDNRGDVRFDPAEAKRELDALGWRMSGQYRTKGGRTLELRHVIDADNPISDKISRLAQNQLKKVGVRVNIDSVPVDNFFTDHVTKGDYDLVAYTYQNNTQPVSAATAQYHLDYASPAGTGANFSGIGSRKLNDLLVRANAELDERKKVRLANAADAELWRLGHQIPIYQYPGAQAVRSIVANFGGWGFATDWVYEDIGYRK